MHLGFGVLKLSPQAFWRMTLSEISAATHPPSASPPDAKTLHALMRQYPD
ncbi:MAG: phage tail assembly chaperone [Rhodobiaceae bacterium]|nr:phage tail assembly chaperone [Rhodobiaceae bacterium]MCC0051081.1 phage tail assembly chaperone [Rhodobiaceae bacterium]MCC0060072.1 phage tail assembly chaperone [Rhodobiaceae bacterium]